MSDVTQNGPMLAADGTPGELSDPITLSTLP